MTAVTTSLDIAATVGTELALLLCAALVVGAVVATVAGAVWWWRERGSR